VIAVQHVRIPDTGGWQDWASVTVTVTLAAGQQTLTVDQDNGGWNVHYLAFAAAVGGSPTTNLALNQPATASRDYQNYVPWSRAAGFARPARPGQAQETAQNARGNRVRTVSAVSSGGAAQMASLKISTSMSPA
jgi:hypothetical protein